MASSIFVSAYLLALICQSLCASVSHEKHPYPDVITRLLNILEAEKHQEERSKGDGYIIGAEGQATLGQFPYQCSLRQWGSHRCGCSLITPEWVLSASHCNLSPVSSLTVVLGSLTLSATEGQVINVEKLIPHKDFIFDPMIGMPNDIMLIKLSKAADVSQSGVGVIAIPPQGQDFSKTECKISGWGATVFSRYPSPNFNLLYAGADLITNQACIDAYDAQSIRDSQMCTIRSGSAPCAGDSGGPLACKVDGKWMLAGVVSWGEDCRVDLPSVFTRVSEYRTWLKDNGVPLTESKVERDRLPSQDENDERLEKIRSRLRSHLSF